MNHVLPKGVSPKQFNDAMAAMASVVGTDWVITTQQPSAAELPRYLFSRA